MAVAAAALDFSKDILGQIVRIELTDGRLYVGMHCGIQETRKVGVHGQGEDGVLVVGM